MNTCEAVEIIEGEAQENINDSVPEKPQVKTVEPYKVKAYVSFEDVDKVDERLHCWMAQQLLKKDPEIFNRKVKEPIFYKLLSISNDGRTGEALTNEPNVTHCNFFIHINERSTHYKEALHFVTGDKWQFRAHAEYGLTEEMRLELKRRNEKREESLRLRALEEERLKQVIIDNTPEPDQQGTLTQWPLLITGYELSIEDKLAGLKENIAKGERIFGWWDGAELFPNIRGENPLQVRRPDFELLSFDEPTLRLTIKEFTPYPNTDKEHFELSFSFNYTHVNGKDRKMTEIIGFYANDVRPFVEAWETYQQQQAILKTLKEAEVIDGRND